MYKKNNFFHSKLFLVILIVVLIILTAGVGTYAWLTWKSTDNPKLTTTIGDIYTVTFDSGADINANLTPVYNYTDGYSTNFSIISTEKLVGGLVTINLNIDSIDDTLCNESIKYVLTSNDKIIVTGDFSEATAGSTITIISNSLLQYGTTTYTFYLYMDGNMENDISMIDKANAFIGNISVSVVEGTLNASEYVTNLYLNANKTNVVNNTLANEVTYSYATSESLMKDRFGGSSSQETGNIRYYGTDPNNYVYFNCEKYPTSSCELWRIIGVFNGKLKIIRNNPFDEKLAWDYDYNDDGASTTYQNAWESSSLQNILNNNYFNGLESTYYGFISGATGSNIVDFSKYSLKNDATKNMISIEDWNLSPVSSLKVYANDVYVAERSNADNIWNGKVGLVSASDYAYSMDFRSCNLLVSNYSKTNCSGNSWLNINTNFWTITSGSGTQLVYNIKTAGAISTAQARIGGSYTVRPVVYLNSDVRFVSGDGSIGNPYVIE